MADLKGKVAVVTGASRGVGRGIAHELGEAGAIVYVTGRSVKGEPTTEGLPGTVDETADIVNKAGGVGIPVQCDHSRYENVEELFERVRNEQGKLDILVNNVWGGYEQYEDSDFLAPFWEQPFWRWSGMFDAGLRAHYMASWFAAPIMLPQNQGLIISTSSGDRGIYRGQLIYDVAKTAVDRMVYGMYLELKEYNIATISVYPGFTRTERVVSVAGSDGLEGTESPRYTGRGVVALASDPNVMSKSGKVFKAGELAREYNFTDIDGTQPPPFEFDASYEYAKSSQ